MRPLDVARCALIGGVILAACRAKDVPPSRETATAGGTVAERPESSGATTARAEPNAAAASHAKPYGGAASPVETSGTAATRAETRGGTAAAETTKSCCGGGMPDMRGMTGMSGMHGMSGMSGMRGMRGMRSTADTSGALASPVPGSPPAGATTQMVTLGDSIFHGEAGGTCFTCHGVDARGTAHAPPLVSHRWLTGDGSFAFIQQRVTQGVQTPTPPYTGAMPPMGGAPLTADQVKAVAAYVYSISHP